MPLLFFCSLLSNEVMKDKISNAGDYAEIILRDEREMIIKETPTVYEPHRIERIYEFADGAVIKYEWQDFQPAQFNHRFTLVKPPEPNPRNFEEGTIKIINYPA